MRIWQLCTPRELYSTETGGAVATVVAALARELVAQGHDVTVAARSDRTRRPETGAEFVSLGAIPWPSTPRAKIRWKTESVLNRVFGWPWPATTTYLRALRRQLRLATAPPEVVVVHNDPFVLRYLRRWAPKATVVLWMHNEPYRLPRRHRPADDADLVVTVSRFIATKVGPKLGLDPSRVVPIHNGVDSEVFHPRPGFDAPATPLRVLCLGRLDRRKGADTALEAVRRLRSEGLAVELDVVGSPWFAPTPGVDQGSWADDFVAELQAAGAHHLPHVDRDQVTAIVRAHDVVCVLSRSGRSLPAGGARGDGVGLRGGGHRARRYPRGGRGRRPHRRRRRSGRRGPGPRGVGERSGQSGRGQARRPPAGARVHLGPGHRPVPRRPGRAHPRPLHLAVGARAVTAGPGPPGPVTTGR